MDFLALAPVVVQVPVLDHVLDLAHGVALLRDIILLVLYLALAEVNQDQTQILNNP